MSQPVPDATEHSHQALTEMMKADAARQEPLTSVIGAMLEETVLRNDLKQKQSSLAAFTGRRPPLSASAFVARLVDRNIIYYFILKSNFLVFSG